MENSIERPSDEDIVSFEERLKNNESIPLVDSKIPVDTLIQEYNEEIYICKLKDLSRHYRYLRRCRGDGNCFFRAASFAWFETVASKSVGNPQFLEKAETFLKSVEEKLKSSGFDQIAYEDFLQTAVDTLQSMRQLLQADDATLDMLKESIEVILLSAFQNTEVSNSILILFRFLTSAHLKQHEELYLPFLEAEYPDMTMEQFCAHYVEAVGRESDQIHIAALSQALGVPMKVAYIDSSSKSHTVTFHEFSPDVQTLPLENQWLHFLYRPGHYDLVYFPNTLE